MQFAYFPGPGSGIRVEVIGMGDVFDNCLSPIMP